jgi:hypothetical protein
LLSEGFDHFLVNRVNSQIAIYQISIKINEIAFGIVVACPNKLI